MIEVQLLFTANDAGDNIYDTHVLLDNIRFSTVWIDVKIITGASADLVGVQENVLQATEILSQAGVNVRLRNAQFIADPGGLLDLNVTNCTSAELVQLLGVARSATARDVNVYYVGSLVNDSGESIARGVAATPEDCSNVADTPGIAFADNRGTGTPAHELGHLLIAPQTGGNVLEHSSESGNFMNGPSPPLGAVPTLLNRAQATIINRDNAPFLVP